MRHIKDEVAIKKGYPSWVQMYDWIARDGQRPDVVAQLIEGAMDEVSELYAAYRTDKMVSGDNYEKITSELQLRISELEKKLHHSELLRNSLREELIEIRK